MPSSIPSAQLIGVDPMLTDFCVQYKQDLAAAGVLIADFVAPRVPTDGEKTGTYPVVGTASWFLSATENPIGRDGARAYGSMYARGQAESVTWSTFLCEEFGREEVLDDREAMGVGAKVLDIENTRSAKASAMVHYGRELRVNGLAFATATVTQNTTLVGTAQWNDEANSSPEGDIQTGLQTIFTATGFTPHMSTHELCCVMGEQVWRRLHRHPELAALEKGSNLPSKIDTTDFANYFGFDQVVVARGLKNSANEGATVSLARIVARDLLIFYRAKGRPTKAKTTFMVTFEQEPFAVEVYRDEKHRSNIYRVRESLDEVVTAVNLGYLIKNAVAS